MIFKFRRIHPNIRNMSISKGKYKMVCSLCKHTQVADIKKYEKLSDSDKNDFLYDIMWEKGFDRCECDNITCSKCTIQLGHDVGGRGGMYICKSCADDTCNLMEDEEYCKVCNCFFNDDICKCNCDDCKY